MSARFEDFQHCVEDTTVEEGYQVNTVGRSNVLEAARRELERLTRAAELQCYPVDVEPIRHVVGEPPYSLEEGVRETVKCLRTSSGEAGSYADERERVAAST